MLGVVIWTDAEDSKAIIWCEDHGELAFLSQHARVELGAQRIDQGDLIQFDLEEHRNLRMAHNPRKIEQQYCSDIKALMESAVKVQEAATPKLEPENSNLLSFARDKRAKGLGTVGSAA
ncbi:hypothetical protein [Planktotalea sp.]|uniref:hypothetical protein n=1 Tax=Planktotalea sp. TaxID=2029877 RepID=UPI003F6D2BA7